MLWFTPLHLVLVNGLRCFWVQAGVAVTDRLSLGFKQVTTPCEVHAVLFERF